MRFVVRRLGFFVLTLWAALTLNFFIPRFMPGSPVNALRVRTHNQLSPEKLQELLTAFGFKPNQNVVRAVPRLPRQHAHRALGHLDRCVPRHAGPHADRASTAVDARAGRDRHHHRLRPRARCWASWRAGSAAARSTPCFRRCSW